MLVHAVEAGCKLPAIAKALAKGAKDVVKSGVVYWGSADPKQIQDRKVSYVAIKQIQVRSGVSAALPCSSVPGGQKHYSNEWRQLAQDKKRKVSASKMCAGRHRAQFLGFVIHASMQAKLGRSMQLQDCKEQVQDFLCPLLHGNCAFKLMC
eukprot:1152901-Pelagomonas_calceolata.AAC.15